MPTHSQRPGGHPEGEDTDDVPKPDKSGRTARASSPTPAPICWSSGIAEGLGISTHTVARQVERIYTKLDVHKRAEAMAAALEALAG